MFIQSFFRGVMQCGGISTRLVSGFNDCPADGGTGANTGVSVGGATSGPSRSIRISSSSAVRGLTAGLATCVAFSYFRQRAAILAVRIRGARLGLKF